MNIPDVPCRVDDSTIVGGLGEPECAIVINNTHCIRSRILGTSVFTVIALLYHVVGVDQGVQLVGGIGYTGGLNNKDPL